MKINIPSTLKKHAIWAAIGLLGLSTFGCSGGATDAAPTNTSSSTYNNSGQTAADKIGAARAKAHGRLPPKGMFPPQ